MQTNNSTRNKNKKSQQGGPAQAGDDLSKDGKKGIAEKAADRKAGKAMGKGAKEGAKKFGLAALLMMLAYTVLITTSNNPILLTILKPLMEITNGFNSVTLSLSVFIGSIFNIDAYYTSSAILPYITSVITDTGVYPLVGFICQAMQGLALLIAPTSIVLLGVTSYLKVSYFDWVKNIWKFFLVLLLVAFILFTIILLI